MKKVYISLSVFALICILLIVAGVTFLKSETLIIIGTILSALESSYLVFAFGTVKVGEKAARLIWGKSDGDLAPGLYFAPPGIVKVVILKGTVNNDELPANPKQIYREEGMVPDGMFPPIRIKFGQPDPSDKALENDPYNIAMVAEVVPVVNWHITSATKFLAFFGETIEECRAVLEDKAVEVFGDEFSKITPAKALLTLDETSQKLEDKLKREITVDETGVSINDAFVKPFVFSHSLNASVIGVSEAAQKAKATRLLAAGEKDKRIEEGIGTAEAEKVLLKVRRLNLKKTAEICGTEEGKLVLWMETLEEAFKNAQYSIVPGSDLFSSVAGLTEMLKKVEGGPK